MLFVFLFTLFAACDALPSRLEPRFFLQYENSKAVLVLTGDKYLVKDVQFHYTVYGREFTVKGVPTENGWEYRFSRITPDIAAKLSAHATYFDVAKASTVQTQSQAIDAVDSQSLSILPKRGVSDKTFFRDDFNSISSKNWVTEVSMYGGFNNEFQVYTNSKSNVYIKNGNLALRPTPTVWSDKFNDWTLQHGTMDMYKLFGVCTEKQAKGCYRKASDGIPPVMSGRVHGNQLMRFGTLEIKAKLPQGDWLWPAIWMMPKAQIYGWWPRSGEIDIMESRGNDGKWGKGRCTTNLHWGESRDIKAQRYKEEFDSHNNWGSQFHVWKLKWTPNDITFYIDNKVVDYIQPPDIKHGGMSKYQNYKGKDIWNHRKTRMTPFDENYYLILNVAVGTNNGYFEESFPHKTWKNSESFPNAVRDFWKGHKQWLPTWKGDNTAMMIDYVEMKHL